LVKIINETLENMTEKTITRADIASAVYQEVKISQHDSAILVDALFEEITKVLANDEIVKIAGFGSFNLRHKKARVGRNPKTGVEVVITPRKVVTFNPSRILRDKIKKSNA
jgi:integration host factor subunit alpha